ncbi:hypothetical protein [Parathalassolituus penaei]|uniref:Uncharacterized protein n=1 Tax=Parathalassolituus penaei TaxID=2997323 RepID=A0A9X3EDM2_9GAMM|nr:hypothetical protein [Parathalassolituus penaei]MCY0964879.1 hypothetical protein [Parathalassolituus penaei]
MSRIRTLYWRLLDRSGTPRQHMAIFTSGTLLFFIGMGILYFANSRLTPSLGQELVALLALAIAGMGALLAAIGYIALSLLRILRLVSNHEQPVPIRSRNLCAESTRR